MSEDENEVAEIRDELAAYKKQIDSLKEDVEILIRFANPHLLGQVAQYVSGVPSADPTVKEKGRRFIERYRSLIQWREGNSYPKTAIFVHFVCNKTAAHLFELLWSLRNSFSESGRGGIRTHGPIARSPDFESGTFDHSATLPSDRVGEDNERGINSK
jgi:hypothetical protein